jgi:alpha-L-arabinofuranosidase
VYDKNEIGFTPARQYAQDFIAFAKAMKGVDPRIKLGAVGLTRPHGRGDADATAAWNPTVIKAAGDYLDFLILHPYYPAGGQEPAFYQGEPWFTAVMAGAHQAMADLREIRQMIAANAPPGKRIGIAITEYGIWPAASNDPRDYANIARALYDTDLLLGLIQDSSQLGITLAASWNLHGSNPTAAIGYNWQTGIRTIRPHYHALHLIMNHLGPDVLETRVSSPTFAVAQVANVKAASAMPLLHAVAFSSPERQPLSLMVINRSLAAAIPTTIRFQGFTPQAGAQVWTLTSNRAEDHNEDLAVTVSPRPDHITDAGAEFSYTFEPHSLSVMEFQAQR